MTAFMKKKLGEFAGFGDPKLLPPSDFLSDDCSGCSDPCSEHKEYPSYLHIDQDLPILGSVKPYGRHIIISTGLSDWPKHIESDRNTFAASLYEAECNTRSKQTWKNLVTNSNMLSAFSTLPDAYDILLYPDNLLVSNVTQSSAQDFYDIFVNVPLPTGPVRHEEIKHDKMGDMKVHASPYKNLLLLCSHKKRDKRCGVTAPILAQELDHVLRDKGLDEYDAGVLLVSHIGGSHKFAGNVVCYINQGTKGIWYGRVKTCHVASIVEETVIKGKVIKDLYRGAMDNSFENQVSRSILKW
ncbi:hypothetical protein G6F64_001408 [Rhizopus arrhizus]|uniref:Altered inheritance of mitochondria protein 32 n=1 Tax=Rhizopus oryzae TaxID=64495 RepID=A0A9P6XIG7_RHIOR|nr:hypothetical protein G6F64_001408 [Rhizopus arrhizus]